MELVCGKWAVMAFKRVLGIDFGGTKTALAVGDAGGRLLARRRIENAEAPADQVVARALATAQALVREFPVDAVGVSTMGVTGEDGVELAPNVPGWSALRLPDTVRAAFPGKPVAIVNDVKAAALAECRWGVLRGAGYGCYLNWGTGIAIAFCQAGNLWLGTHGAAGEIAYLWEVGQEGFGHGRAPLEEAVGGGALDRMVRARFGLDSVRDLFDHLEDPVLAAFWADTVERVAVAVGRVLVALDVERVALGGGLARRFEHIAPGLDRVWAGHLPFPPRLMPSAFLDQAGVMGALAAGLSAR